MLLGKQCLCSHKDSKLRFPALPETAVSACWGSTPYPLNSPIAGLAARLFHERCCSCDPGKDGACAPLQSGKAAVLPLTAVIEWQQDW